MGEVGQKASVTTDYCHAPFNRLGCHMLSGVVSNAITGAGRETIELGITASGKVASVVALLPETGVAAAVGWAKSGETCLGR